MRGKAILIGSVVLVLFVISWGSSIAAPPLPLAEWEQFKARYHQNPTVDWDEQRGTSVLIAGAPIPFPVDHNSTSKEVETVTKQFIIQNSELLRADLSQLVLVNIRRIEDNWYVAYDQMYKDLPVIGGRVGFDISTKEILVCVSSGFFQNIDISILPGISKDTAIDIAKSALKATDLSVVEGAGLAILPRWNGKDYKYHLIWVIVLNSNGIPGYVHIDAQTGETLGKDENILSYAAGGQVKGFTWLKYPGASAPNDTTLGLKNQYVTLTWPGGQGVATTDYQGITLFQALIQVLQQVPG